MILFAPFLFFSLILILFLVLVIVVVSIIVAVGGIFLTGTAVFAASASRNRWPNLFAFLVGLVVFVLSFITFSLLRNGYTSETDNSNDNYMYVQVMDQYTFRTANRDTFLFSIYKDEMMRVLNVDSIAQEDSLLYGRSGNSYFALDMRGDWLQCDSLFSELHLNESCSTDQFRSAYSFYRDRRENYAIGSVEFWALPLLESLLIAFGCGYVTRRLVAWLQEKLMAWRKRSKENSRREGDFSLD